MKLVSDYGVVVTPTVTALTGEVLREYPPVNNMITDYGMNRLASIPWASFLNGFILGTGTTPTNRKTGNISLSRVGTIVTTDLDFFTNDDAVFNRVLQFSDDSKARIVKFTSEKEVLVDIDGASLVDAGGIIWNVEQDTIDEYYTYTSSVDSSQTNPNGATWDTSDPAKLIRTTWRSLYRDFLTETEPTIITEAGWTHSFDTNKAFSKLFGRIVFPVPITVNTNERLVIKVEMSRSWVNGTVLSLGDGIFDTPGTISFAEHVLGQYPHYRGSYIFDNGEAYGGNSGYHSTIIEPSANTSYRIYITGGSADINELVGKGGYIQNSFTHNLHTYTTPDKITGSITQIKFGNIYYGGVRWIPDTPIVIPDDSKFWMKLQVSWDRKLQPYVE